MYTFGCSSLVVLELHPMLYITNAILSNPNNYTQVLPAVSYHLHLFLVMRVGCLGSDMVLCLWAKYIVNSDLFNWAPNYIVPCLVSGRFHFFVPMSHENICSEEELDALAHAHQTSRYSGHQGTIGEWE